MSESYDFDPKEALNLRNMNVPIVGKVEKNDALVSKIVGKPIRANNSKLIKIIMKYKQSGDSDKPDNLFKNPKFVAELKATL